jgi:hypothetical protein
MVNNEQAGVCVAEVEDPIAEVLSVCCPEQCDLSDEWRRLHELEVENARLRMVVADLTIDNAILSEMTAT